MAEDHLIVEAATDGGTILDSGVAARLLWLAGEVSAHGPQAVAEAPDVVSEAEEAARQRVTLQINARNARYFDVEVEKLDRWADDLKLGLEREIKEVERRIRGARKGALATRNLDEKLAAQKALRALEGTRNKLRKSLFDAQDEIDRQRDALITAIEGKLAVVVRTESLFSIRWFLT